MKHIVKAYVCHYHDNGQTLAYVDWSDGSHTSGPPDNPHMVALLERARRDGVAVAHQNVDWNP